MAIPKKQLIGAKLAGIVSTLERTPAADKKNLIALEHAIEFNELLKQIEEEYPDLGGSLPKPLSTRGPMTRMGRAPCSYLDLEIVCEQILNLLNLVEA